MIEEIKTYEVRKKELIEKGKETGFITYEQFSIISEAPRTFLSLI